MFYSACKRVADFLIALISLVLLSPVLLGIGIAVKLTSKGPMLFRQVRVGKNGKFFHCYKFRSMKTTAPQSPTSELRHADFYITRLGAFLRKYSLDELPQLFNILKGDMSLIGPRPLIPAELTVHDLRLQYNVYRVRPGMTGWAQIHGRDTVSAVRKAKLDRYYVEHFGLLLDAKILWLSVARVLCHADVEEGEEHSTAVPARKGLLSRLHALYCKGSDLVTLQRNLKAALPRLNAKPQSDADEAWKRIA
jgi:O-antigen biosynthesis protein WbqP